MKSTLRAEWFLRFAVFGLVGLLGPAAGGLEPGDVNDDIVVPNCQVRFRDELELPARDAGLLKEVRIRDNQVVRAGEVLAVLDDNRLRSQQRIADVRGALLKKKLDYSVEVELAETAYLEAKLEVDENTKQQRTTLGAVSASHRLRAELALRRAELERERVKRDQRLAQLELEQHEAEKRELAEQLERLEVLSPFHGVVLSAPRAQGEWVRQGDTVVRVASMETLQVSALVSESQLSVRGAPGTPVTVRWSENGKVLTLRGLIETVDPQIRDGGQYRVHVKVENRALDQGWLLVPGRSVTLVIHTGGSAGQRPAAATARRLGIPRGEYR